MSLINLHRSHTDVTSGTAHNDKVGSLSIVPINQERKKNSRNPLLNMPIAARLVLGFLLPVFIASIALSSVGYQSSQLLIQEAQAYQGLLHSYISLSSGQIYLQQMDLTVQQGITDAAKPNIAPETIREDVAAVRNLNHYYDAIIESDVRPDMLDLHPDIVTLFRQAGHADQIVQQRKLLNEIVTSWHNYLGLQAKALDLITTLDVSNALTLEYTQVEPALAQTTGALLTFIQFNNRLVNSVQDAAVIERSNMLYVTILALLSVILGISLVGWIVSSTLINRLNRLRVVVQSVEKGHFDARASITGRDEIARVSLSVNAMLDTIVGLLEETRQQRDALANAEELQQLHTELKQKHDALNEANSRLEALSVTDPLTGLPNHRAIMSRIDQVLTQCQAEHTTCAILFIDIDHFKRINDTWGHRAGDAILRAVGSNLASNVRFQDLVGRYGGEEFSILLTEVNQNEAAQIAERLREAVALSKYNWETEDEHLPVVISISISVGVAVFPAHGVTREALIEAADQAMYQAKHSGRNRVCIAGEKAAIIEAENKVNSLPNEEQITEVMTMHALTAVARVHDGGTSAHSQRMVRMAEATARKMGRSIEDIQIVRLAALLHDIGKVGVPDAILHKPGPLSQSEWVIMRNHPELGRQILKEAGGKFELLSHIVVAHHERWDGKGYPYGLANESIPLAARILSVVDSFDAMTSDRPYRKALTIEQARQELLNCAGSQYDPGVVTAFMDVLDDQVLSNETFEFDETWIEAVLLEASVTQNEQKTIPADLPS